MTWQIIEGSCLEVLPRLDAGSVQTVVTSPPYWGLRDYGTATWEGGDPECDHAKPGTYNEGFDERYFGEDWAGDRKQEERGKRPYRDVCGKCGAKRIDSQLGLEPTPEQYVENLVAVFREVRRVLRDDGTVWLNLGDSYASGGSGGASDKSTLKKDGRLVFGARAQEQALNEQAFTRSAPPGLKPKDLVGIPWMVAKALQAPYYTGTIKNELDRVWLAAMIDAEGCMFIHRRKAGQSNGQGYKRKSDSFGSGLEVSSTDRAIVERCLAITGRGSICEQTPDQNNRRKQTLYRWNLRTNECRDVIREVYPYLTAKQHEARLVCGVPSSGKQARAAWEALKSIHQGGEHPNIDFPAPESMFERGWFLRSDVIWAKLFPTPCPSP